MRYVLKCVFLIIHVKIPVFIIILLKYLLKHENLILLGFLVKISNKRLNAIISSNIHNTMNLKRILSILYNNIIVFLPFVYWKKLKLRDVGNHYQLVILRK